MRKKKAPKKKKISSKKTEEQYTQKRAAKVLKPADKKLRESHIMMPVSMYREARIICFHLECTISKYVRDAIAEKNKKYKNLIY
jgi:hypothetical protein